MRNRCAVFLTAGLLVSMFAAPGAVGQMRRSPSRGRGGQQDAPRARSAQASVLPVIQGTFKAATKKLLTLEVEEGNTMELHITRKTTVYQGEGTGKKIKLDDLKPGDHLSIETSLAPDASFDAVRINRTQKQE
jgi:hypothetical protein